MSPVSGPRDNEDADDQEAHEELDSLCFMKYGSGGEGWEKCLQIHASHCINGFNHVYITKFINSVSISQFYYVTKSFMRSDYPKYDGRIPHWKV